jgi:hypothetical protein
VRPSRSRAVLGALLAAGIAGWVGYRLVSLEGRLLRLEVLPVEPPPLTESPPPSFSAEEVVALKQLLAHPPVSEEALAALRRELARPSDPLRPGVPAALQNVPMPAPIPAPVAVVETAPAPPLPPPSATSELSSVDPLVRYRALEGLSRPDEAAAAVALLSDEMGFVRRAAAAALGRLKIPETVPDLVAMARREKDVAARLAALQALQAITGVGAGPGESATALSASEAWWASRQRVEGRVP